MEEEFENVFDPNLETVEILTWTCPKCGKKIDSNRGNSEDKRRQWVRSKAIQHWRRKGHGEDSG